MNSEQQYIDLYLQAQELICRHSSSLMNSRRQEAFEAFRQSGFPGHQAERYKYTDVAQVFSPDYGLNLSRLDIPVNPYEVFRCDVPNLSTSLYFVLNDQFYDKALPKVQLPDGVIVSSLNKASVQHPELLERCYGRLARSGKDAINALNTMLAQDGLLVYVPRGVVVDRTIQVVNILRADVDLMVNRRVLVVLEDGAQARILVCDHALDDRNFLATQVSEIFVGENAHLELYELEETHVKCRRMSNMYVQMQANSTAVLDSITLQNGLTRNRADVRLDGPGAEVYMNGCVIADQKQHVDNNTLIDHAAAHCQSHQLYKYVLDDEAVGAFAGRILVREGAQHTVSKETNANLCASRTARMYAQPMLEIYADDVKCSHGSTVGQLGDAALFYMRQRGIPEDEARMLLKFAFVGEVIDSIRLESLRDRLHHLAEKRFRGELSRCKDCKLCK
ncbi:MAG: Fe-S cluster assembly protein SufD [Bacteroidaceae bacterium]|nr:Fe-S cluster assembly protein SufD [Bacteroidaceae bacterium]